MRHFPFLFRKLLLLSLLFYVEVFTAQVPCESIKISEWRTLVHILTCNVRDKTVIEFDDTLIASPRNEDESVGALNFYFNPKVHFLPVEVYLKFPNLVVYTAFQCSVKTISKKNFKRLNKLSCLELNDNLIESIPSNTFEDLISLMKLNLSKKNLKIIKEVEVQIFIARTQQNQEAKHRRIQLA